MNLWVKRTGQLFIAVLFLMSCEDDSFLLGFKNKNRKFNVRHQEFTLPSTVILIDSIITDNHDLRQGATRRLLLGEYQDVDFGTVRSEFFTQVQPGSTVLLDASSIYDSVTIQLRLDLYSYGLEGVSEEQFTIHEITEDSLTFSKSYYYNSSIGYDITPLGEVNYTFNYDTLKKNEALGTNADTLLVKTRLDDEFGIRLFTLAKNDFNSTFTENEKFRFDIKGLAFIPVQSNVLMGFNPSSTFSKVVVHYHTTTDTLERAFFFNPINGSLSAASFNKIITTRSGDLASMTQPYEGYAPPSGRRYLQNGSPVITKIDISEYYDFIRGDAAGTTEDSLQNIIINSAEISFDVLNPPDGLPPPSSLILRIMNSDDMFLNTQIDADSAAMAGYYYAYDGRYYLTGGDAIADPATATIMVYDSDRNKYVGYLSIFMQNLFNTKNTNNADIQYLGLFPVNPSTGKTVNRAVFNQNSVKLKVHYTAPVVTNLQ